MDEIEVEIACALPRRQRILPLAVPPGTTVAEAIERSGIRELFPEVAVAEGYVGIFGKACPLDQVLEPGDRVELYRPLEADPREARRRRAQQP